MLETLQTFGYKPEQTARWFNCPMAFDNEGGNWIQESTETSNPYYGAMMLKCGSEESKIVGEK